MQSTTHLWHPISEAKLYESAGSRTSFSERWSRDSEHGLAATPVVNAHDEDKEKEKENNENQAEQVYLDLEKQVCDRLHRHC